MKRFLVCAVAIAADLAAIASVIVGCTKTDLEPQETRWRGADCNYESSTAAHPRDRIGKTQQQPEK